MDVKETVLLTPFVSNLEVETASASLFSVPTTGLVSAFNFVTNSIVSKCAQKRSAVLTSRVWGLFLDFGGPWLTGLKPTPGTISRTSSSWLWSRPTRLFSPLSSFYSKWPSSLPRPNNRSVRDSVPQKCFSSVSSLLLDLPDSEIGNVEHFRFAGNRAGLGATDRLRRADRLGRATSLLLLSLFLQNVAYWYKICLAISRKALSWFLTGTHA